MRAAQFRNLLNQVIRYHFASRPTSMRGVASMNLFCVSLRGKTAIREFSFGLTRGRCGAVVRPLSNIG